MKLLMLFGFLAAVNCAHITTVQEVNKLVERIISETFKEKEAIIPEFPEVEIEVNKLKREGDCVQTAQPGIFECKAVSVESQLSGWGEKVDVVVRITFEVVVDSDGHLVRYEAKIADIEAKSAEEQDDNQPEEFGLGKKLKKLWKKVKHAAEKILHEEIKKKVTEIVTSIAASILS